jgi:hypothetical protein
MNVNRAYNRFSIIGRHLNKRNSIIYSNIYSKIKEEKNSKSSYTFSGNVPDGDIEKCIPIAKDVIPLCSLLN